MKVRVKRTSDFLFNEIREYKDLEECCKALLTTEDYGGYTPELVISLPDGDEYDFLVESPLCGSGRFSRQEKTVFDSSERW